jgi:peptide/nickel transport system substrate-binding protein
MANLGYHYNGVCSPTAAQKWGDQFASHPVGTGPYKLVKWDLSQGFLLERNDEYHGEKAKTKYLEFKIITDDASRAAALESGQVDVIDSPPPQKVSELLAEGFNVPSTKSVYVVDVWMNNQFGPLKDVRVRRALNYAVDKEAIKTMLGELVDISQSPISPTTWGYSPQAPYPYDPVMAKQLLAEAGYPDGFKIKMWGPQGKYLMDRQIAEAIVGYLSKVGVDVDLSILEWGSYVKIVYNKNATNQLFLHGWSDPTLDPDFRLSGNFYTKGSWWYLTKYDNSAVDRMLEEARYTVDQNSRMQLFADIQSQMWQDAPYIWLHSQREMLAMKSTVKGLFPVPTQYHDLAAAYMPAGSGPLALAGHTNYIAAVLAIVSFANSSLQRKKPFD